jgi:hypothetical protein
MTEQSCENCMFFAQWHGIIGHCRNPRNAAVKHVGGGAEYSSSEQCLVAMATQVNMVCDYHEPTRPANVRQVYEMVELPRSPELKPWESTPWARVDAR